MRSRHLDKDLKEVRALATQKLGKCLPGRELTKCKPQGGALLSTGRSVGLGQSNSMARHVRHCEGHWSLL